MIFNPSRYNLRRVTVTSNYGDQHKSKEQTASVVAMHRKYDIDDHEVLYDIALIRLNNPFEFSDDIAAAPLAGADSKELSVNDECVIAGWGRTTKSEL